jgi:hypothetical protein
VTLTIRVAMLSTNSIVEGKRSVLISIFIKPKGFPFLLLRVVRNYRVFNLVNDPVRSFQALGACANFTATNVYDLTASTLASATARVKA